MVLQVLEWDLKQHQLVFNKKGGIMNLTGLGNLLTLQGIRGSRSQITIAVMGVVKLLAALGYITITPEQLTAFETTLMFLLGIFILDKVDDVKKGTVK